MGEEIWSSNSDFNEREKGKIEGDNFFLGEFSLGMKKVYNTYKPSLNL